LCLCAFAFWFQGCGRRDSGNPPYAPRDTPGKFRIDHRFKIELFAAEPLLNGPVALAFDEKGRTFVFESSVFPPKATDRWQVILLGDTDGDGKPDRSTEVNPDLPLPSLIKNWEELRGRTSDPEGHWFLTRPSSHVLQYDPGSAPRGISDHGESATVFPITENPVYPVLADADRTTSTCAIAYYSNPSLPGFERAVFTAEPAHNLVHCDLLTGSGRSLVAHRAKEQSEFLASADAWFRPVGITVGPDRALYVVDFYGPIAGPTEVLEVGTKSSDYMFHASGRGRIYRITPLAGRQPAQVLAVEESQSPLEPEVEPEVITLPGDVSGLEKMIADPRVTDTAQAGAVRKLGAMADPSIGVFLLSKWRAMTAAPRSQALEALFKDPFRLSLLIDMLEKGQIPLWCLDDGHRVRILGGSDRSLAERLRRLLETRDPRRDPLVRKYEDALVRKGDPEAGEQVYKRLCGRCHTFRGGSNYGPDLWTVSSRPPRRILVDILLPSNAMAPGRELFMIDLKGGGGVEGVIGTQTATSLNILHDESRQETVLRDDIQRLLMSDFSAMPVDLASQITVQEMADLLRFLTRR
jgi:putative heme-binding domain-containing protein